MSSFNIIECLVIVLRVLKMKKTGLHLYTQPGYLLFLEKNRGLKSPLHGAFGLCFYRMLNTVKY
jgi:hypothetical protein